jgi:hypothetical protein
MPADVHDLLRDADPARDLPPIGEIEAERLRLAIVGSPRRPVRRRSRAPRLALVAALLAIVLGAAGFTAYKVAFETSMPAQVQDWFVEVRDRVPLPPGATWHRPNLDRNGVYAGRSQRVALMEAINQAQCAWFSYWDEGGTGQKAYAIDGMRAIRKLMPLVPDGAMEDEGGFPQQSLDAYDGWVAAAAAGDGTGIRRFLIANC